MSDSDNTFLARTQAYLSYLFLTYTFVCTMVYECGFSKLSDSQSKDFSTSLTWMQGAAGIVIFFWFNRARVGGLPPDTQVITQTHTAADGSKTTITTPANQSQLLQPPLGSPPSTPPTVVSNASPAAASAQPPEVRSKVPTVQPPAGRALAIGGIIVVALILAAVSTGWRIHIT